MPLSDSQIATFKTAILAETDPTLVSLRTAGATGAMTDWYNAASTFIVWKTRLTEQDITSLTSDESTIWSWPAFIPVLQGQVSLDDIAIAREMP